MKADYRLANLKSRMDARSRMFTDYFGAVVHFVLAFAPLVWLWHWRRHHE